MHRYHPVYPYKNENRERLLSLTFQVFRPKRIILYCETICEQLCENDLICQGQCVGHIGEKPVYSGITGRIDKLYKNEKMPAEKRYTLFIFYEVHANMTWSQIPFLVNASGDYYLCQLGVAHKKSPAQIQDVLWIDGMESQPFVSSRYRLFVENCVKIVLGADIFARYLNVTKVYFGIESDWHEVAYLLEKYLAKYKSIMAADIAFEIKQYERCYPPPYVRPDVYVISPQIAVHAYHGVYEQEPAVNAYLTVSGCVKYPGNYIVPVGTKLSDLLSHCQVDGRKDYRFILDGVMSGTSVNVEEAVINADNTSVYVMEVCASSSQDCTYCSRCAKVCPMGLKPYEINDRMIKKCMQCGCCSYVCPSHIRISENIKHYVNQNKTENVPVQLKNLWRYRNLLRAQKFCKRKINHGKYVEIAPEFLDYLEPMAVVSDAPPHIHDVRESLWMQLKRQDISLINQVLIILCVLVIIACILGLYHL